jgi:hypothetical protein
MVQRMRFEEATQMGDMWLFKGCVYKWTPMAQTVCICADVRAVQTRRPCASLVARLQLQAAGSVGLWAQSKTYLDSA